MLNEHGVGGAAGPQPLGHHLLEHPLALGRPPGVEQDLDARRVAHERGAAPAPAGAHLLPHPHRGVHVPCVRQPVHDRGERGGVGVHPGAEHLGEEAEHGGDPAGLAEEVEHGGVGVAVVAEGGPGVRGGGGGEAEEEEGLLEGRVGLEDARHDVRVPDEAREGEEERARLRPGVVAEYVGHAADDVASVRRGGWLGGGFGLGLRAAAGLDGEEVALAAEHFRRRRGC